MLDPAVSSAIRKYGLFKWCSMEYPHLVFGAATALVGLGIAVYAVTEDAKNNAKTKYFQRYVVMRPDDPRLRDTVIWGEDGQPIN